MILSKCAKQSHSCYLYILAWLSQHCKIFEQKSGVVPALGVTGPSYFSSLEVMIVMFRNYYCILLSFLWLCLFLLTFGLWLRTYLLKMGSLGFDKIQVQKTMREHISTVISPKFYPFRVMRTPIRLFFSKDIYENLGKEKDLFKVPYFGNQII